MYHEDSQRQQLLEAAPPANLSEFYQSLNMCVTIAPPDTFAVPRFSQLTQRTNQFNFTTRRYSEGEIRAKLADPAFGLWTISLEDRFGKLGVIGAAIVHRKPADWELDTFLMSCRALGRGVEDAFLATLVAEAQQDSAALCGTFIPSKKNGPARQFLERLKFALSATDNSPSEFEIGPDRVSIPSWIRVEHIRPQELPT
jgi:FkbH-like protein